MVRLGIGHERSGYQSNLEVIMNKPVDKLPSDSPTRLVSQEDPRQPNKKAKPLKKAKNKPKGSQSRSNLLKPALATPNDLRQLSLSRLGFNFKHGGAHLARTMMLDELSALLDYVKNANASIGEYRKAVVDQNCLAKRSLSNRIRSFQHLKNLYSLDPTIAIFRALRFFWSQDAQGRPLLALLCAYVRDPILRLTSGYALKLPAGETVSREAVEKYFEANAPTNYTPITLTSLAQRVISTWTKAGIFSGHIVKKKSRPIVTVGSLAYALFLSYLVGERGQYLFKNEYIKLLACSYDQAINFTTQAAGKGWLIFRMVGEVVEVQFPNYLSPEGLEIESLWPWDKNGA
jgi:hypothetical protein